MKVLFLGDVVGKSGCDFVAKHLNRVKKMYEADVCIINGENSAEATESHRKARRCFFLPEPM